jgi:biopolymer transport protein ExbB
MFDYVLDSLSAGGWILFPIFLTSVLGWTLIFKSWFLLNRLSPRASGWKRKLRYPRVAERWLQEMKPKERRSAPARVLRRIQENRSQGREAMLNIYDEEMKFLIPRLESGLTTLAVLAGAAPLLGLLGTVSGMVGTFNVISVFGTGNPALMAGSIGEALVTTQNGLLAALPLMIAHIILINRSTQLEQETDKAARRLINYYVLSPALKEAA